MDTLDQPAHDGTGKRVTEFVKEVGSIQQTSQQYIPQRHLQALTAADSSRAPEVPSLPRYVRLLVRTVRTGQFAHETIS